MRVWLKELRDSKQLTRRALAERLHVSHRTIEDIEFERRQPGHNVLFALERELGPAVLDGFKREAASATACA